MSPVQAKQKQHERYEAVAVQVFGVVPVTNLAVKAASVSQLVANSLILSLLPDPEL